MWVHGCPIAPPLPCVLGLGARPRWHTLPPGKEQSPLGEGTLTHLPFGSQ